MTAAPSPTDLTRIWQALASEPAPGGPGRRTRRVLVAGTSDVHLSVDFPRLRRVLTVVAGAGEQNPISRPGMHLTSGIEVSPFADQAGRPGLDLALVDASHTDIFTALVADLLTNLDSENATNGSGLALVVTRIRRWQRLLAGVRPEGLSAQQQRGLFGELHLLRDHVLPATGHRGVAGWTGPDPACQDFQFPRVAVEVKTTPAGQPGVVHVNGERQLDRQQPGALFLVTYVLDGRRAGPGMSLPDLVDDLRSMCATHGVLDDLDNKLTAAGYLTTQAHLYDEPRYTVSRIHVHRVRDDFPRIVPATLPTGVSGVTYTLDLHAAGQFAAVIYDVTDLLGPAR